MMEDIQDILDRIISLFYYHSIIVCIRFIEQVTVFKLLLKAKIKNEMWNQAPWIKSMPLYWKWQS